MMHDPNRDPAPDPRLREALGTVRPDPPVEEVDWERLSGSITGRAALPLARRRRAARLHRTARWGRVVLPGAAAAALALYLGGVGPFEGKMAVEAPPADTGATSSALVEEVVRASLPAAELERWISGRAEADALLMAAVGGEVEM